MNMTDRDRRAIYLGVGVVTALALVQFALLPWVASWRDARQRITTARTQLLELEVQVSRISGLRRRVEDVLGPAAGRPLPMLKDAQVRSVKAAEQLLQTGGVQVTSVRPQAVQPLRDLPGISMAVLQVDGQAQFMQVPACLASIGSAEMLLLVEKLTLAPSPQQPGMMAVTLVLAAPALQEVQP